MAIGVFPLTVGKSTLASTAFQTASYAPSANRLILLAVVNREETGPNIVVEGNGATWVRTTYADKTVGGGINIALFRAMSTGALTAGATTIRFTAVLAANPVLWSVAEFSGVSNASTDGAGAIAQTAVSTFAPVNTTIEISLAPFGGVGNLAYGAFGQRPSPSVMTTGGGFNLLHSVTAELLTTSESILTEWKLNSTLVNAVGESTNPRGGIAIEIVEAAEGSLRRMMMGVGR